MTIGVLVGGNAADARPLGRLTQQRQSNKHKTKKTESQSTMPEERIYRPVPDFTHEEIASAIIEDKIDLLIDIAFAVGYHGADWKYAQDVCIQLSEHANKTVRGNAILGLSYVARFQGKLDKRLVKPVLFRALRDPELEVHERAEDAIPVINRALNWNIANYHKKEKIIGVEGNKKETISRKQRERL